MSACRVARAGAVMAAGFCLTQSVSAQSVTAREVERFAAARKVAEAAAPTIWPGFRLDTIPLQLVVPGRGSLLLGWRGSAPSGYVRVDGVADALWVGQADRGAASTSTQLGERAVAQVVVNDTSPGALAGLIAHESFHAFERSVRSDSVRFGSGENSYYVSQYPIYDIGNETQFALELAVLRDAIRAATPSEARARAREFVAVRTERQHRLDVNVSEFEAMSEMNEGLAEYALLRAASSTPGAPSAAATASERLRTLLSATNLSIRLRYYLTGSAQALLLDRIGPADWKTQMMRRRVTLQEMLAEAVGAPTSPALVASAERTHGVADLAAAARSRVAALQTIVRARADSLMHVAGVHFTLDGSETGFGSCGFDPQNMLQLGGGALLHTRWLKVCQHGIDLEFNTAVMQDGKRIDAVAGAGSGITITAADQAVPAEVNGVEYRNIRIASPGVTGTIARARITRTATTLIITPLNP